MTNSFPTRRSSDLAGKGRDDRGRYRPVGIQRRLRGDRHGVRAAAEPARGPDESERSEEHTSELQSLMRLSYAVLCLKKKNKKPTSIHNTYYISHNDNIPKYISCKFYTIKIS